MEAIILAGGLGTRLRGVVDNIPKCMAPVAGKPFLFYLLQFLQKSGFAHVILSLGYKHEIVTDCVNRSDFSLKVSFVVEEQPLGTGGAVKYASAKVEETEVFVLNGDTFLNLDYQEMLSFHRDCNRKATLALKEMEKFNRYGMVEIDSFSSQIIAFHEKEYCEKGLINGGTYLFDKRVLEEYSGKFSLEKDFFEAHVADNILTGFVTNGYFIDIGIPEDYEKAQKDFKDGKYRTL